MPDTDLFSQQAAAYARYRPHYPAALFEFLANAALARDRAWDCATGSGQAAIGLTARFQHVVATDASADQIAHAQPHPGVTYYIAAAERSGLASHSVDAVTAAQALHWFDLDAFYAEVGRVLRPGGLVAAWCYGLTQITPAVDDVLASFSTQVLGAYWDPRVRLVEQRYQTIPFPFEEVPAPRFTAAAEWTLEDAAGYLGSFSSARRFCSERGHEPIDEIWESLAAAWGPSSRKHEVRWPLYMRVGRTPR